MENTMKTNGIVEFIRNIFMLTMALTLGLYGLIAIDAGRANYGLVAGGTDMQQEATRRKEFITEIQQGKRTSAPEGEGWRTGYGQELLAQRTDAQRAYGSNLGMQLIQYATVPKWHMWVLATHSTLGGICMLMGALQFWPALRRKKPFLHKRIGKLYVYFGLLSMALAAVYLTVTPPERIYSGLTFYIGLWSLVILAFYSMIMAVYHAKQGQIAQHQVFMSLNFGLFLTAPLLRYDWLLLGMIFPSVRQEEINASANIFLIPQSVLFGYGFLLLNRMGQPLRKKVAILDIDERVRNRFALWMLIVLGIFGSSIITMFNHFVITPGIEKFETAYAMIPMNVIQHEMEVLAGQNATRFTLMLAIISVCIIAPFFIWTAFKNQQVASPERLRNFGFIIGIGTIISGIVLLYWGYLLGIPNIEHLTGGTFYTIAGLFSISFGTMLLGAVYANRQALIKEWGMFSLACIIAVPSFYTNLIILKLLNIPDYFINDGHGYLLAAASSFMSIIGVFVYTAYSSATHEKVAY
jgi:uncharacterized membrane protein